MYASLGEHSVDPPMHDRAKLMICESSPDYGDTNHDLGIPEAHAVDALLKSLHQIGNEVRLEFLHALRILDDGNLCIELGFPSLRQYCDREFGLARSTVFEYLRVAVALDRLPRLRAVFGQGALSWQQVREISRVATTERKSAGSSWPSKSLYVTCWRRYARPGAREGTLRGRNATACRISRCGSRSTSQSKTKSGCSRLLRS